LTTSTCIPISSKETAMPTAQPTTRTLRPANTTMLGNHLLKSVNVYASSRVACLDWLRSRVLLIGIFVLLIARLPSASAQGPCLVQSVSYDFPSSVTVGQQITVQTQLTATCVQWGPYWTEYSIRVDLTNISTAYVLSTTTYQVGYAQTYIDQVFLNTATAPTRRVHGC